VSASPVEPEALAAALRELVRLRDRVVVVELPGETLRDDRRRRSLASSVAAGRAVGIRLVLVTDAGLDEPLRRFVTDVTGAGERAIPLPALGVVTFHPIPDTDPLVVVNPTLVVQLASLGSVPTLFPPVADALGEIVPFDVALIARSLARSTDAALRVVLGPHPTSRPTVPDGPPVLLVSDASLTSVDRLLVEILLPGGAPSR
jgi:hypothetical protein